MLADGREATADIDVLCHQGGVLDPVASAPTVWRTLDEVTPARLKKSPARGPASAAMYGLRCLVGCPVDGHWDRSRLKHGARITRPSAPCGPLSTSCSAES